MLAKMRLKRLTMWSKLDEKIEAKRRVGGKGGRMGLEDSQSRHN